MKSTLKNSHFKQNEISKITILSNSEALEIGLPNESIDCVITSPLYSFAIDYVENDKDQLEFLGYNTKELKTTLIGLKGKNKTGSNTNKTGRNTMKDEYTNFKIAA